MSKSAIPAIIPTWLLSLAILLSAVHFNVAQAQTRTVALACGKQLQKQCGGVPVLQNKIRECLQKSQGKIAPRCVALANNVVRSCERDALQHCQAITAGQSNILGCLRTAKRVVSWQCSAALDTAFLR
jgi:hypothetical protein